MNIEKYGYWARCESGLIPFEKEFVNQALKNSCERLSKSLGSATYAWTIYHNGAPTGFYFFYSLPEDSKINVDLKIAKDKRTQAIIDMHKFIEEEVRIGWGSNGIK